MSEPERPDAGAGDAQPPGWDAPPGGAQPPGWGPPPGGPGAQPPGWGPPPGPYGGSGAHPGPYPQPGPYPPGPHPPGYGAPGYGAPPPGWGGPPSAMLPGTTTLAILSHAGSLIGIGFILPLIIWLIQKDKPDRYTRHHAAEALNFQLSLIVTVLGAGVVGGLIALAFRSELSLIGLAVFYLVAIVASFGALVMTIIAMVKASQWQLYRYPLCIRFVDRDVPPV